ncbi:MAG: hypothetical protein R2939_10860 [Kofleriaceae bacterium]
MRAPASVAATLVALLGLGACGSNGAGVDASGGGDGGNGADADTRPDRDGDGLADDDEAMYGTDPDNPDSDGDGVLDGLEVTFGMDPLDPDSDDDGILDGDELLLGTDPLTPDSACAESSAEATLVKLPVDIILVVDTSGSMGGEIDQIQANLNDDLAVILEAAELDYRVILIGDYYTNPQAAAGAGANNTNKLSICIAPPLGGADCTCVQGANCTGPAAPAMTERFKHYDVLVDSRDGLRRILNDFAATDEQGGPGWGTYLREGAQKVFVMITDDDANGAPATFDEFDTALLTLSPAQFGSAAARNYVFHSILGMAFNTPATAAWPPTEPVQESQCSPGSDRDGRIHQAISIGTEGLRFPLCNNDNFDVIFNQIADDVVEGAALGCSFVPEHPMSVTLDFERVVVYYTEGGATLPLRLDRVADAAACTANGFYVDGDEVVLCPAACTAVQADPEGSLDVHVACTPVLG